MPRVYTGLPCASVVSGSKAVPSALATPKKVICGPNEVGVGRGVLVAVAVMLGVGVTVGVRVTDGVRDGVLVSDGGGVSDGVLVGDSVGVSVGGRVPVGVTVGRRVFVPVGVRVGVRVFVGVRVMVGVRLGRGLSVGVRVGPGGSNAASTSATVTRPSPFASAPHVSGASMKRMGMMAPTSQLPSPGTEACASTAEHTPVATSARATEIQTQPSFFDTLHLSGEVPYTHLGEDAILFQEWRMIVILPQGKLTRPARGAY